MQLERKIDPREIINFNLLPFGAEICIQQYKYTVNVI